MRVKPNANSVREFITMRLYHSRVELQSATGETIRRIPGPLAEAMVGAGSAEIASMNGKVRSIRLTQPAAYCAQRIGDATGKWGNVRFTKKVMLDGGFVIYEHHPRCLYEPPE